MADIQIFDSPETLYAKAAEVFLESGAEALRRQGKFSVALSGGSTPLPLYRTLSKYQAANSLDWNKVHFFWGDERAVKPDHPDSNYRSVYESLLEPRAVSMDNIHRIEGELQPELAAHKYQKHLLDWFGEDPPRFDLILLGLGSDGHTASLFPGTHLVEPATMAEDSWVDALYLPHLQSWRISFTAHLINAGSQILFIVRGSEKAGALKQVLKGSYKPQACPAQLIQPENGRLVWLVDRDAAAELND